jgi:hypothetical protein
MTHRKEFFALTLKLGSSLHSLKTIGRGAIAKGGAEHDENARPLTFKHQGLLAILGLPRKRDISPQHEPLIGDLHVAVKWARPQPGGEAIFQFNKIKHQNLRKPEPNI